MLNRYPPQIKIGPENELYNSRDKDPPRDTAEWKALYEPQYPLKEDMEQIHAQFNAIQEMGDKALKEIAHNWKPKHGK